MDSRRSCRCGICYLEEQAKGPGAHLAEIYQKNFSSIKGTWKNNKGGEVTFDEYGFSYKVETVDGNTDYWLYAIKHGDNYPTKTLDCNYIGGKEFYEILDDLKISGKSAPAQKLHAEKKA